MDVLLACRWADPDVIPDIQHIGLSCWDRHVSYRNIEVHPPLDFSTAKVSERASGRVSESPADCAYSTLHEGALELSRMINQADQTALPQRRPPRCLVNPGQPWSVPGQPCAALRALGPGLQDESSHRIPGLFDVSSEALGSSLRPDNVFDVCTVAELLLPNSRTLYR